MYNIDERNERYAMYFIQITRRNTYYNTLPTTTHHQLPLQTINTTTENTFLCYVLEDEICIYVYICVCFYISIPSFLFSPSCFRLYY
jgi:hypothetical protein